MNGYLGKFEGYTESIFLTVNCYVVCAGIAIYLVPSEKYKKPKTRRAQVLYKIRKNFIPVWGKTPEFSRVLRNSCDGGIDSCV